MGKKGTKKKTQWRILSITECPPQNLKSALTKQYSTNRNNVNITSTTETSNNEGAVSPDDDCSNHESSYSNPTYLKRKSSTSSNYRNDYRNNSKYSYNSKQNSASSTSSLHSSSRYTAYRRRPFSSLQNGSSRYSYYGAERTTSRGYRPTLSTTSLNQDTADSTKKLLFNEDDYTRISTPRQDVIFKKGCFSQPKKYVSSTDTNTTSSAAASIVSAEESVSALSIPSLSPEQCSSIADSLDPEQGFVYSLIDQNGVVYSYVPNGFDQYNGQMMMLPYGYPPYLCSPDITSPTGLDDETEETHTIVESQEIPQSDLNETKVIDEVPTDTSISMAASSETLKTHDNEDNKDCESPSDEATVAADEATTEVAENGAETKVNEEIPDTVQSVPGQFYNYGYPPYYPPPILYPYMIPQQFVPLYGNEFDIPVEEDFNEGVEDQNTKRYNRCRKKRRNTEGNSTGISAATTDYSEDESEEEDSEGSEGDENCANSVDPNDSEGIKGLQIQSNETENKAITLDANVEEFVPRGVVKSTLNVNVREFLPKSRKEPLSNKRPNENSKQASINNLAESTITPIKIHVSQSQEKAVDKKRTELTLAEKIKMRLADETNSVPNQKVDKTQRPLLQRRNTKKMIQMKNAGTWKKTKESIKFSEKAKAPTSPTSVQQAPPSYAQIANTGVTLAEKSPAKEDSINKSLNCEEDAHKRCQEDPMESTSISKSLINKVDIKTSDHNIADSWQTVKPRGKRGKQSKEQMRDDENSTEPAPETISLQKEEVKLVVNDTPIQIQTTNEPTVLPQIIELQAPASEPESVKPTTSALKKTPKTKNRKSSKKAADSSSKKKKKIELIEPVFELPKTEKPASKKSIQSFLEVAVPTSTEAEHVLNFAGEDLEETPFLSTESDFSFDQLYLGKRFNRDPLDILKGFDYKFKPKSILKEEEEMVLSVIKSLNNSTSSGPTSLYVTSNASPLISTIDDTDSDEKTIEEAVKCDVQDGGFNTDTSFELNEECKYQILNDEEPKDKVNNWNEIEGNSFEQNNQEDLKSVDISLCEAIVGHPTIEEEFLDKSPAECNELFNNSFNAKDAAPIPIEILKEPILNHIDASKDVIVDNEQLNDIPINSTEIPNDEDLDVDNMITGEDIVISNGNDVKQPEKCEPLVNGMQSDAHKKEVQSKYDQTPSFEDRIDDTLPTFAGEQKLSLHNGDVHAINGDSHLTNGHGGSFNYFVDEEITTNNGPSDGRYLQKLKEIQGEDLSQSFILDPFALKHNARKTESSEEASECNGFTLGSFANEVQEEKLFNGITNGVVVNLQTVTDSNISENNQVLGCSEKVALELGNNIEVNSYFESNKIVPSLFSTNSLEDLIQSTVCISPTNEIEGISRSSTESPFALKDQLFEDLNDISVPQLETDMFSGSNDFVACVNALNTIIKSRECSLEPGRSRDSSVEPNHQSKVSQGLERILIDKNLDKSISPEPNTESVEPEDFKACISTLNSLIKNRECSKGLQFTPETTAGGKDLDDNKSSTSDESKELEVLRSQPYSTCVDHMENNLSINQALIENNENQSTIHQTELTQTLTGCVRVTSNSESDLPYNFDDKESSRTFKTSISCDHSSGIGSDCEDNQPTSPGRTDQVVAQNGESMPFKPLFPIYTNLSENGHLPQTTTTSKNVLPTLSQTNSATCDNQSVSYTSSKNSFNTNANLSLNSISRSSFTAEDDPPLDLSTSSKFPHQNECQAERFPLTAAVKQWLIQESKESTPELIFRIPEDPSLKTLLEENMQNVNYVDEDDWSSTDESEDGSHDYENNKLEEEQADYLQKHKTKPKNLKSNPLHASSCNAFAIDSDSDYNSDSTDHPCTVRIDDKSCKRVAQTISDKTANETNKNDLLEFWDDEFVSNPRKWLTPSESILGLSSNSSTATLRTRQKRSPSTDPEPYVSVYGQTIDYMQLQANKYESLSNNILSVNANSKNSAGKISSHDNQAAIEQTQQYTLSLSSSNNNFCNDKDTNKNNAVKYVNAAPTAAAIRNLSHTNQNTENCLKPPEVCCILM